MGTGRTRSASGCGTAGLTTPSFASPSGLQPLVERSLRELAETLARVDSGVDRERVPAEPQPVRASKFVNPATGDRADLVPGPAGGDRAAGPAPVRPGHPAGDRGGPWRGGQDGDGGRLLKSLEAGRLPDVKDEVTPVVVGGIVYLSSNGVHRVEYPTLVADLLRLLPGEEAQRLDRMYQDPHNSPPR